MKKLQFYRLSEPYGELSNFAHYPVELNGQVWPTAEHYFQAQKFAGTVHEEEIRQARTPMIAARMGRSRERPLRADWETVKGEIMRQALMAKFTQHPSLRSLLLETGDAELIEHTKNDSYWGDGGDGTGNNRLGQLLMEIRKLLRVKTQWLLKQKNILDEPADVLICSANVNLALSGGVGADLLARYGNAMQIALQEYVHARTPHCAQRGDVIPYTGPEIPYKAILHAVAIDGWYESTSEIITAVIQKAFGMAAEMDVKKVALTALATGFGHLTFADFAKGVTPLLKQNWLPIQEIVICLLLDFQVAELARHLPEIEQVSPDTTGQTNL